MRLELHQPRLLRTVSAATLALAILLAPTFVFAASPSRDPEVALSGNTVAGLNQAGRIADEDAGKIIDVQLALKLRNRAQLDDLIRRVSTPRSPEYGHYLTPAQFGAQFGPTAAQVDQATAFLRDQGLQVVAAAPGSTLVDARGTVAAVQQALQTQIGHYREPGGREFFANDTAPALPSRLAANVTGVEGLDNRHQRHHPAVQPRVCPPTCAGAPYTPTQLRTGFGLTTAPLTALTGTGQTLGLFELDGFRQANIDGYNATYSLPALIPQPQVVDGGPVPAISNPGEIEVELDIEVMHALAPGATIMVFEGPNSNMGVNDTYNCMVSPASDVNCPNNGSGITAPSNSTSWGLCEPSQGPAETNTLGAIFAQGAVQGQSFFAASGDTGAYDCYPDTSGIWVDSPASDPNVTGVGGTKLFLNPDNSYSSEIAWPAEPQAIYGSGGGKSIYWPRPSWQTGPGVITTGGAPRQVPDVSLDADPVTGYSIYTCANSSGSCTGSGAGLRTLGGTSAGAPAWAAFTAIYNQYATCQGKPNLGFANPTLYSLGSSAQTFTPFHDVTTGDNKEGTGVGYSAGASYDMVTGWGTLRAAGLARDVAGTASSRLLLTSVAPNTGGTVGGTLVTLTGCGFTSASVVQIGGLATATTFVNANILRTTMPSHSAGQVSMSVVNPGPVTSNTSPFTYVDPPPLAGGIGPDNGLWALSGNSGFSPKGGQLLGAPAIVGVPRNNLPAVPLYLGTGLDHNFWVRSDNQGWQQLASGGAYCIDNPAATVVGPPGSATLYVACEGGDHSLWYNSGPVTAGTLPVLGVWAPLGGGLAAGPAVASVNGAVTFLVLGTDHQVWGRTLLSGYSPFGAHCNGHPALATTSNGVTSYFACDGTDGSLWYATNSGGGWSGLASPGGHLVDGPGIAALLSPSFFVEGTDNTIWEWSPSSGWVPHGGRVMYGAGATSLS